MKRKIDNEDFLARAIEVKTHDYAARHQRALEAIAAGHTTGGAFNLVRLCQSLSRTSSIVLPESIAAHAKTSSKSFVCATNGNAGVEAKSGQILADLLRHALRARAASRIAGIWPVFGRFFMLTEAYRRFNSQITLVRRAKKTSIFLERPKPPETLARIHAVHLNPDRTDDHGVIPQPRDQKRKAA